MRVLLFAPYGSAPVSFERELEIAQQHLDAGDEVTMMGCDGSLPICDTNIEHWYARCWSCRSKRRRGLALLSPRARFVFMSHYSTAADRAEARALPPDIRTISALKALRVEEYDLGWGSLASLITHTRESRPSIEHHAEFVHKMNYVGLLTYRAVQRYIDEARPDLAYIWNGRITMQRAAIRACESKGVRFATHEHGHDENHFGVWNDSLPHDLVVMEKLIREAWQEAAGDPPRDQIGAQFFERRRAATNGDSIVPSFVADQDPGALPAGWDPSKRNIAVFISSDDEWTAVGDSYNNPIYLDQTDGLTRIVEAVRAAPRNVHLHLRMHPYMKGTDNSQTRAMAGLAGPCVTVIPSESRVSSYALLDRCETVLTFGSTVGIEAPYWGKASILPAKNYYMNLGGTYNPTSHDEVMSLLHTRALAPRSKEAALMYGYYFQTFGRAYKYLRNGTHRTFKGQVIQAPALLRAGKSLRLLAREVTTRVPGMEKVLRQRSPWFIPPGPSEE